MSNSSPFLLHRSLIALATVALILFGLVVPAQAVIDDNATKQIWKLKYGVSDAQLNEQAPYVGWLNKDDDGDGIKNKDEIAAGTNPFSAGSVVKITSITNGGSTVNITFPTEAGKQYAVQATPLLTTAFTSIGQNWTGTGVPKTLTVTKGTNKFFRILVQDIDSDGDGVSDWAEQAVGLNPNIAETISGLTTLAYVNQQIVLPNVVTIMAATPFASEDGPTAGKFTVTRTQNLFPTTVNYGVAGTATPGTDYATLATSVTFPAHGATSQDIIVNPTVQSPAIKGGRSVTATLQAPGGAGAPPFTLGANTSATVIINSSTVPTGTGLLARYYDTASSTYLDAANFGQAGMYLFTRGTPTTTGTIVVSFTGGTIPGLVVGNQVKVSFTSGSLNNALYNNFSYPVTAVTASSFTLTITAAAAFGFTSTNGNCNFSNQSITPPATVTRVDPTVNFDWQYGTPNGNVIAPNNSPDNYSSTWEAYLQPTTAGNYIFQLDADDKARVLLDTGSGLQQIVGHNWTTPGSDPVGTFKQSASIPLVVPATPAQRYKIRVEHVETTGDARCRLQWNVNGGSFANIPQTNQFTHTQALTYTYAAATSTAIITPTGGHTFAVNDTVPLSFSSGVLFTPGTASSYNATYTVTAVGGTSNFTVAITGFSIPITGATTTAGSPNILVPFTTGLAVGMAVSGTGLPAGELITAIIPSENGPGLISVTTGTGVTAQASMTITAVLPPTGSPTGSGFVLNNTTSVTTGLYNLIYPNTAFSGSPGRVGTDATVTAQNNGIWGAGTPDTTLIQPDTFSVRWTGQVQPQFSEDYTFVVQADDGCALWINGQPQVLKMYPSANTGGSTYTYDSTTGNVVVTYSGLVVNPNSFIVGESVRLDPSSGNLAHAPTNSPTYSYNGTTGEAVIDYTNLTTGLPNPFATRLPGSYLVGETVEVDPTSGNASPLANLPYVISAVDTANNTFTVNLGTGVYATGTGTINVNDTRNAVITGATSTTFTVNIGTGKYANNSTGSINVDIANKGLKDWSSNGNERYVRIPLIGGVRYDIQLDMWENTSAARCILSWFSASQTKQAIPSERLYPANSTPAPPSHTSPTDSTALVGGPFSYDIAGSNAGIVTVSGNPVWLTYANGVLSGTPPAGAAGDYQIIITITNAAGTGTSVLNLHVDANAGNVVREYWNGVTGTTVASIPTGTIPTGTATLTSLAAPTGIGPNYGARIRGYITAPTTGNYYFWVAGNNAAELWISNDGEPVNALKRAWVTAGSATPQTWNVEANQKSPWLALEAGKKYYVEILHKAGTGTVDNLAVGWAKPGEAITAPSQVVPGYALSPYVAPAPGSTPGTLYFATMLAQAPAVSNGVGSSTLRLSEDENTAYVKRSYSGMVDANGQPAQPTSEHIHSDLYLTHPSTILYDIDTPATSGDGLITNPSDPNYGAYKWTVLGVGTLSKADVIEIIREGKAYINLHTTKYPNGEIRGNYTLAGGSRTFTAPPAPPAWTDDHTTDNGAVRFLTQTTFGANIGDIQTLKGMASYDAWIDDQFNNKGMTPHLPEVLAREIADVFGAFDTKVSFNTWWKTSMTAPDQLRQRVAFALSEIHVVSGQGPLEDNSRAMSHFYDTLAANAFGNFRDILVGTTLTPGMGRYLDMLGNDKPDISIGRSPNENYAREIQQLFSIGLYRMWPDGTLILDSTDSPVATYTQREIVGFAHTFTGWSYNYSGGYLSGFPSFQDWTHPMREVPARHFTGPKRVLNNEVLPGLATLGGQPLDPYATHLSSQYGDPAYQALPAQDLNAAHDQLFNHPNAGPFICRQLIQRMVTSNPSRDYLYRVVQKFNDNGAGVRGDMKTVIKAILLDYEARSSTQATIPAFGKQREPVLRVAQAARALRPANVSGTYSQLGTSASANTITITTTTPHLLQTGNSVFLEFTDTTTLGAQPAPTTGTYTVLSTPSTTSYTIAAPGWLTGTYSQTGTTITVTMNGHYLPGDNANVIPSPQVLPAANKGQAYFDFTSGGLDGFAGFDRTVRTVVTSTAYDVASAVGNTATAPSINGNTSGTTFTITAPDSATRSGTLMISRFAGSYSCTGIGGTITIDTVYGGAGTYGTMADHGLSVGDSVFLNFTGSRDTTSFNETSTENDIVYTIGGTPDPNTFTVPARNSPNAAMNSDNQVVIFPLKAQPLVRNGTVTSRPGTYTMDNTDSDIAQTPLNSTTVFNFFLPDYKFAGTLASQGITTPEFQLTAETTVVRQANFLYNGIFNPSNTTGISSFKTGTNALVLDLSPWMGNATDLGLGAGPQTGQAWTSNANLGTLIDRLNTLLLAGQLPSTAKTTIQTFLYQTMSAITSGSNPCAITSAAHGLVTGDSITISGVTGGSFTGAGINSTYTVTVTGTNTFTIPITCTNTIGLSLTNAHFSPIAYTNATPSATNIRDRLRTILHLILTSPDYTIQR